ncbi:plasmid replication protein [Alkalihalobacillus oceani]|uniref:Plasmid replication protein n=1 Tax=Halalkalibacter oceani TaxID=1653776 RepID=A0A9X2IR30_9BACI|nr:tubulin-like doman-containing protein [Halalkalibacter oceani]MCM3716062.1 plasmid replication protein [Halalkalibacter oceani]
MIVSGKNDTQGLQQQLLRDSNVDISMKFGFLGLGMGGCSIAAACADIEMAKTNYRFPYSALLVNTNKVDLDKIETKNSLIRKLLVGNGKGAGRNPSVGEQIFRENQEAIKNEILTQFKDSEFVWVVAGLGGGTGTGSIIQAAQTLYNNGFDNKFGLILTLPRLTEGKVVLDNALEQLQTISRLMDSAFGSIILVDNNKLYGDYTTLEPNASVSDYLNFSNEYVADTLHELNIITASFKPYGEFHFDSSEFENLIKTPRILHLAKFSLPANSVDTDQSLTYIRQLEEYIQNGVLSGGYRLNKASRLAVSIITNESTSQRIFNLTFSNTIEKQLLEIAPIASERPIAQYKYNLKNKNDIYFYVLLAGLPLPTSIKALVEENTRLIDLENATDDEDEVFSALAGYSRTKAKKITEEKVDPFSTLSSSSNNAKTKKPNPFDLL